MLRRPGLEGAACIALALACNRVSPAPPTEPHASLTRDAGPVAAAPRASVDAGAESRDAPDVASEHGPTTAAPAATETDLAIPGFLPALVSWPSSEHWPQPLLIAAHGAGDSAEAQCEVWRELLGRKRGVVACPRGRPIGDGSEARGYYYPSHLVLEREVLGMLAALGREHGARVDGTQIVYAGYSQGATMGALMLVEHALLISRWLLIEGGTGDWSATRARRFAKAGGRQVSFACGTPACQRRALHSVALLQAAGLESTLHYAAGGGHTYVGAVLPEVVLGFSELVDADPRWAP